MLVKAQVLRRMDLNRQQGRSSETVGGQGAAEAPTLRLRPLRMQPTLEQRGFEHHSSPTVGINLHHFIEGTRVSEDLGICRGSWNQYPKGTQRQLKI